MREDINIHFPVTCDGEPLHPIVSAILSAFEDSYIFVDIAQNMLAFYESNVKLSKELYPNTEQGVFDSLKPGISDLISIIRKNMHELIRAVDKIEAKEEGMQIIKKTPENDIEAIINSDIFKKAIQEEVSRQMYKYAEVCNKTYENKDHEEFDKERDLSLKSLSDNHPDLKWLRRAALAEEAKNEIQEAFLIDLAFALINGLSFQEFFKVRNVTLNDLLDRIALYGNYKVQHIQISTLWECSTSSGIVPKMHAMPTVTITFSDDELTKPVSRPCRILRHPIAKGTFDKYITDLYVLTSDDNEVVFLADLADEKKIDD